jgi:hypothetical protein
MVYGNIGVYSTHTCVRTKKNDSRKKCQNRSQQKYNQKHKYQPKEKENCDKSYEIMGHNSPNILSGSTKTSISHVIVCTNTDRKKSMQFDKYTHTPNSPKIVHSFQILYTFKDCNGILI